MKKAKYKKPVVKEIINPKGYTDYMDKVFKDIEKEKEPPEPKKKKKRRKKKKKKIPPPAPPRPKTLKTSTATCTMPNCPPAEQQLRTTFLPA